MLVCCTQLCFVLHGWCAALHWCCLVLRSFVINIDPIFTHTYRRVSLRLGINWRRKTKVVGTLYGMLYGLVMFWYNGCSSNLNLCSATHPRRRLNRARSKGFADQGFADGVTVRTSAQFRSWARKATRDVSSPLTPTLAGRSCSRC